MAVIGLIVLVILLSILLVIFKGFVITQLWGWFMVPLGIPDIGIAWAIGLSCIISAFTYRRDLTTKEGEPWAQLFTGLGVTLMVWFMGYIAYLFM